jgi:hypothetical protein
MHFPPDPPLFSIASEAANNWCFRTLTTGTLLPPPSTPEFGDFVRRATKESMRKVAYDEDAQPVVPGIDGVFEARMALAKALSDAQEQVNFLEACFSAIGSGALGLDATSAPIPAPSTSLEADALESRRNALLSAVRRLRGAKSKTGAIAIQQRRAVEQTRLMLPHWQLQHRYQPSVHLDRSGHSLPATVVFTGFYGFSTFSTQVSLAFDPRTEDPAAQGLFEPTPAAARAALVAFGAYGALPAAGRELMRRHARTSTAAGSWADSAELHANLLTKTFSSSPLRLAALLRSQAVAQCFGTLRAGAESFFRHAPASAVAPSADRANGMPFVPLPAPKASLEDIALAKKSSHYGLRVEFTAPTAAESSGDGVAAGNDTVTLCVVSLAANLPWGLSLIAASREKELLAPPTYTLAPCAEPSAADAPQNIAAVVLAVHRRIDPTLVHLDPRLSPFLSAPHGRNDDTFAAQHVSPSVGADGVDSSPLEQLIAARSEATSLAMQRQSICHRLAFSGSLGVLKDGELTFLPFPPSLFPPELIAHTVLSTWHSQRNPLLALAHRLRRLMN